MNRAMTPEMHKLDRNPGVCIYSHAGVTESSVKSNSVSALEFQVMPVQIPPWQGTKLR